MILHCIGTKYIILNRMQIDNYSSYTFTYLRRDSVQWIPKVLQFHFKVLSQLTLRRCFGTMIIITAIINIEGRLQQVENALTRKLI